MGNAIIMMVLKSYVAIDISATLCPDKSQWSLRADSLCNKSFPAYFCLFDDNKKIYKEFCETEPDAQTPGHQFVIRGGLDIKLCDNSHYQPFKLTTNGYSQCMFEKTKCIEEGQMQYDNGTTTSNRLCRCDYSSSYNFIKKTRRLCYCDPTEEDCSCYKKMCPDGYVMSPDYVCIDLKRFSGNSHCPEIKRYEIHREQEDNDYSNMVTKQFKDLSITRQSPITRLPHIVIFCVIVIFGIIALAFAISRPRALGDRQKIKMEMREHAENKIRLLKNYHEIIENIVPSDIISHMSYDIFSLKDLTEINDMLTQTQKARRLVDILINTDQSGYQSFLSELIRMNRELRQLAITIENTKVFNTEHVSQFQSLLTDTVPKNIRNLHNILLTDWIEYDNRHIVYTDAILNLYSELQYKDCVTIIGPRGSGKSATLRSTVLMLMTSSDFEIIPCTDPSEILSYFNTHRNQIFLFDDVCETHKGAYSFFSEWNKKSRLIETMIKTTDNARKRILLFAFDAISFETVKMRRQWSSILTQNVFNMLSPNNRLKEEDANDMAKRYKCKENNELHLYKDQFGFYPELCRRYGSCNDKEEHIESVAFQIMDDFLKDLTDEDEVLLATLSIFVIFGNNITNDMLHTTISKKLSDISRVLYLTTDMLSTITITHKLTMMIESNMYIQKKSNTYTFISPAIFMGVVSFFCNHYFHFILELSTFDSLSHRLGEWKTYIKDRKIKLPNHKESTEKYFHDLSGEVSWWQNKLTYKRK